MIACYKDYNDEEWTDLGNLQVEVVWGGRTNTFAWSEVEHDVLLQNMIVVVGTDTALQIPFGLQTASSGPSSQRSPEILLTEGADKDTPFPLP